MSFRPSLLLMDTGVVWMVEAKYAELCWNTPLIDSMNHWLTYWDEYQTLAKHAHLVIRFLLFDVGYVLIKLTIVFVLFVD